MVLDMAQWSQPCGAFPGLENVPNQCDNCHWVVGAAVMMLVVMMFLKNSNKLRLLFKVSKQ